MRDYYHEESIHNLKSPQIILPIVFDFLNPKSILDIGCGIGTWLYIAKTLGIDDTIGVDADYVERKLLEQFLELKKFEIANLVEPLNLNRKFDLEICLEVAEHLPESSSGTIVQTLVNHSDLVLFSAAIPGQGGQNHINEQWPEYWANKFSNHGYVFLDIIRPLIWDNPQVDFWYKQNMFLVVKYDHDLAKKYLSSCLSLVHPELFKRKEIFYQKRITSLERSLAVHPIKRWIKTLIKSS